MLWKRLLELTSESMDWLISPQAWIIIYALEMLLLIVVRGWRFVWGSTIRKIIMVDLLCMVVLLPFSTWTTNEKEEASPQSKRVLILLSCVPLTRLLAQVLDYHIFAQVNFPRLIWSFV